MSTRRIQNPEGAKTVTLSFKTAAGATLAIARQNIKIVCFSYVNSCRLRVDPDSTAGGKQQMNAQGRRMVLIYMASMHAGLALSPKMCTGKTDKNVRLRWLNSTLQHIDHHHPTACPQKPHEEDETMEEQPRTSQHRDMELPPSGSGQHTAKTAEAHGGLRDKMPFIHGIPTVRCTHPPNLWDTSSSEGTAKDQQ